MQSTARTWMPVDALRCPDVHRAALELALSDVRRAGPDIESPAFQEAVASGVHAVLLAAASGWVPGLAVRRMATEGLRELLRREYSTTDVERRLAFRWIQGAVDTLETALGVLDGRLSDTDFNELVAMLWSEPPSPQRILASMRGPGFQLAALEFTVVAALECLDAELDELTGWARLSHALSCSVRGRLTGLADELDGELARLRARRSWDTWDEHDVAAELRGL